jgi:hypothetical protein
MQQWAHLLSSRWICTYSTTVWTPTEALHSFPQSCTAPPEHALAIYKRTNDKISEGQPHRGTDSYTVPISTCSPAVLRYNLHGAVGFDKLKVAQLVHKFPVFHGTRWLITMFTWFYHQTLTKARSIQSTHSRLISVRFILILSYLRLGLPKSVTDYANCIC